MPFTDERPVGAGGTSASDSILLGTSGTGDWTIAKEPGTNNRLAFKKGAAYYAAWDPTLTGAFKWAPGGDLTSRTITFEDQTGSSGWKVGPAIRGANLAAGSGRLILAGGSGLVAGEGVCAQAFNNTAGLMRTGWDYANATAEPTLKLLPDGSQNLSVFGATGAGKQTFGAATAGGTYDATAQSMLQKAYDAFRNFGFAT